MVASTSKTSQSRSWPFKRLIPSSTGASILRRSFSSTLSLMRWPITKPKMRVMALLTRLVAL